MVMVFGGLLVAVISIQVYRGIVAFRNPDQELPSRTTPAMVWILAVLVLVVTSLVFLAAGSRIYGGDARERRGGAVHQ
jgi:hypothetical protein